MLATSVTSVRSAVCRVTPARAGASRRRSVTAAAKLISSSDIPAFIPRSDLMEQLWRWADIEVGANGSTNFGAACKVEQLTRNEVPWGFSISVQEGAEVLTTLKMCFDEAIVAKHAFIGRQENGMPMVEGEATDVEGAHFEMWKMDDKPVTPELREAIRGICVACSAALTRYYSFGSVFAEDI